MTFGLTIVFLRPRSVFYLAAFIDNSRLLRNVIERGCNFHRLQLVYFYQLIRPALYSLIFIVKNHFHCHIAPGVALSSLKDIQPLF